MKASVAEAEWAVLSVTAPRHVKEPLHISADWRVKTPILQQNRPADLRTRWVVTNHRWLQTALGLHKCLAGCLTKGFPASLNFKSELPTSSPMWSVNTGPPNTRKGHLKYIYGILPTSDSGNWGKKFTHHHHLQLVWSSKRHFHENSWSLNKASWTPSVPNHTQM
jgi:hypothetical protein